MDDLISRQAAIEAHYEYCNKHPDAWFPVWSLKILEDMPSAQPTGTPLHDNGSDYSHGFADGYKQGLKDAESEIVRCKDCTFYRSDGCFFSTAEIEEDGFCSWAERRTDDGE